MNDASAHGAEAGGGAAMGHFPATHWTLVARAGQSETDAQRQALVELLSHYLPALRAHLVRRKGIDPEKADDLLQQFLTDKVLDAGLIAEARRERGRFRTFLLTSLDRFVTSQYRKESAKKRSAPSTPLPLDERIDVAGGPTSDGVQADVFDMAWARELLSRALAVMERECASTGRGDVWGVFEARILGPMLGQSESPPYEQLVERFGFQSPAQASNVLMTAKRTFARVLRGLIAEYEPDETRIEEEIADLHEVFSRGAARRTAR